MAEQMAARQRDDEQVFGTAQRGIAAKMRVGGSLDRRLVRCAKLPLARIGLIRCGRTGGGADPGDGCCVFVSFVYVLLELHRGEPSYRVPALTNRNANHGRATCTCLAA